MRRITVVTSLIAINVLVFLVLAEAAGLLAYWKKHDAIFYTHDRSGLTNDPNKFKILSTIFHPYLGYINRLSPLALNKPQESVGSWLTNNRGFQFSSKYKGHSGKAETYCCDYPYQGGENEVLVGVFGGSVAAGFSLTVQATQEFAKALGESEKFRGKKITVLQFGVAGYRQPQQVQILSYMASLGQRLDYVVNIDGFNEAITTHRNFKANAEPAFPADDIWGDQGRRLERLARSGATPAFMELSWYRLKGVLSRREALRCGFAVCYLWHTMHEYRYAMLEGDAHSRLSDKEYEGSQYISWRRPSLHSKPLITDSTIPEGTTELWANSSRAMSRLSTAVGARYLHVLQPNQWAEPGYTPKSEAHNYVWVPPILKAAYKLMRIRGQSLAASEPNMTFLDAAVLLPAKQSELFSDDCCHYTPPGNSLLANAIAKALIAIE